MSARLDRMDADMRFAQVWDLGGIAHDPQRVVRIAAAHDWPYLCVPVDAFTRQVYEMLQARQKPLDDIIGIWQGRSYHATKADLLRLWRADARRSA